MFRIKICGITNSEDAAKAIEYAADAFGFVFTEKSPRKVSKDTAAEIIEKLPKGIYKVGVFFNQGRDQINEILGRCKIDMLQLHGDETPEFCERFAGYKIIKAFRIKGKESLENALGYNVDAYLLDTYLQESAGGTGKTFDWSIAKDFIRDCEKPVILSGGLNPSNVIEAIRAVKPYAVDVSSGVESSPGKKDHALLREFIEKAKMYLEEREVV